MVSYSQLGRESRLPLLKEMLLTLLLTACCLTISLSQICFDGSYCPNNDIVGNCNDPNITDEWATANVLDPLTDFGAGGTCDITQIWAISQNPNIYVAFTAGNQGASNYSIYFNTDCDNTTGDVSILASGGSPNGAEFRLQFRVQQGNASNLSIAEYINNAYVTTTTSIAAMAGASDGCPAPDGTASNFNFVEIEFNISDIFDPCLANSCSSIEISYVQTQAGGSPGSADCDAISETLEFEVNQPPTAVIVTTTPACAGNIITFDGSMSIDSIPNDDTLTYDWILTDLMGNVLFTTTDSTFDFTFADPGKYLIQLSVEDSFGCQDTSGSGLDFDTICIFGAPIAAGEVNIDPCSLELTFDALGSMDFTDLSNLEFLWDFGDGNIAMDSSGVHLYTECGNYNISLIVNDPDITFDDCKFDTLLFEIFIDTVPPMLTCPGDIIVDCGTILPIPTNLSEFINLGGDTTDNCTLDPLSFQLIDSSFAMGVCPIIEVITLSFSIADDCGNMDTCSFNISINDTLPPVITFQAMDSTFDCSASPTDLQAWIDSNGGAMANDLCSDVTWTNNFGMFPGVCADSNFVEITFYAEDNCGNMDSTSAVLTINDNTAPQITIPAMDTIVECDGLGNVNDFDAWTNNQGGAQATDDCDGVMWRFELINSMPDCANTRVDSVKFLVYDVCGNIDSTVASFTIIDTGAPVPNFAMADIVVNCASDLPLPILGTAQDLCLGAMTVSPIDIISDSTCVNDFTITRSWTFIDSCGNDTTLAQLIIVKDSLAPIPPVAPMDLLLECASDVPMAADLIAQDGCNGALIASPIEVVSDSTCVNDFTITRSWTFIDSCGNDTTITQLIIIKDSLAPIPPAAPMDLLLECVSDVPLAADLTAQDGCNGALIASPIEVVSDSTCVNDFTITRSWTFIDSCGNDTTITQLIVVKDSLAPIPPAAPMDLLLECATDVPIASDLTAQDGCNGALIASPVEVVSDSTCLNDFTITRSWTFIDSCGNDTTIMQLIIVKDSLAPIPPAAPMDLVLACADDVPTAVDLTALDGCNGDIIATAVDMVSDSICINNFSITRSWTFVDSCGNDTTLVQLIEVQDTMRPMIICPDDVAVQCGDNLSPDSLGYATATDNCTGNSFISFMDFTMGGNCPDEMIIRREWMAQDTCGNVSTCDQIITIIDGTAPTFDMLPPNDTLVLCPTDIPSMITLNATDNCGSMFMMGAREDTTEMICDNQFILTRTWVIEDPCGNSDSVKQVITVNDTLAPMFILLPKDTIVECDGMGNMVDIDAWIDMNAFASATDGCGGLVTWTNNYIATPIDACGMNNSVAVTFYISDNCGNMDSAIANFTLQDTTPPVAACQNIVLDFMNLDTASIDPSDIDFGSTDICGDVILTLDQTNFNCFDDMDSVTVELTATDLCGNSASCFATVVFENVLSLELTCPSDTVIQLAARECDIAFDYMIEARSCSGNPIIIQTDTSGLTSGDLFPIGQTIQSYLAYNEFGDTARCTFIVEVLENPQSPNLACVGSLNISLNQFCFAEINAGTILVGDGIGCIEDFILCGPDSSIVPGPTIIIGAEYLGQMINISVKDPETGNICWTKVTIEDKLDPVLFCKTDTIECDDSLDPLMVGLPLPDTSIAVLNSDGSYDIMNYDFCGPLHLEYYDANNLFDCDGDFSKIILRFWTATDVFGNQARCIDTIKIQQSNLDSIILPPNRLGVDNPVLSCETDCLLPNGAPDPICSGMPSGPICETVVIEYEDFIFNDCGGSKKIHRSWTIFDLCSGDRIDHEQWIKLADTLAPVIQCPDTLFIPASHACNGSTFVPFPEATDNCSGFSISQVGASGPFDIQQTPTGVQLSNLPMGLSSINFIAIDLCGNSSTCTQFIMVQDVYVPIPVCKQPLTLSLSNGGLAKVNAEDLNDGSIDCMPTYYKVIRMDELTSGGDPFGNGVSLPDASALACQDLNGDDLETNDRFEIWFDDFTKFCCADVDDTEKMVVLRVFDKDPGEGPVDPQRMDQGGDLYGRYNDCMVGITVQDKLAPECFAPNDTTITCSEYLDLNNLSVFGSPVINDFCGADYTTRETMNVDCGSGLIRRIFTVTDPSGSSVRCTQRIRVQNIEPFNADSIIWPANHVINDCAMLDLRPEGDGLPIEKRYPIIGSNACSMAHATYEDEVFNEGLDACFKIFRNWAVIDWCQQDADGFYLRWEHTQIIEVHEEEQPQFTGMCQDTVICIDDDCNLATYLLTNAAMDCAPASSLDWTINIDLQSDGSNDFSRFTNELQYDFPAGTHTVTWTVKDPCNNQNTCLTTITVVDCKIPSAACQSLIVEVMPPTGMLSLNASVFNYQSSDNCTEEADLRFSYSADPLDTLLTIDCVDILNATAGPNGYEFPVSMYVHDLAGNVDFCNLTLTVQDNQNACNSPMAMISGLVQTSNQEMVEAAKIQLSSNGQQLNETQTSISGYFDFDNLITQNNFSLAAKLDDDPMNGISTYDIVLIQKHILGIDRITSPYYLIAADVNASNSVSAVDMIELRKLILGITDHFTNNESWRFVPAAYEFPDPFRPWNYDEAIDLELIDRDNLNNDFIGVKIGDINGSVVPNSSRRATQGRHGAITLEFSQKEIYPNQQFEIPVYLSENMDITGLQFSLDFDPALIQFNELSSDQIVITSGNIGEEYVTKGEVNFSWNNADIKAINKDLPIFIIKGDALSKMNLEEAFSFSNHRLNAELYDANLNIYNLEVESLPVYQNTDYTFELMQNVPNPFKTQTNISFVIPENENINLQIYNEIGALVYNQKLNARKGYNVIKVELDRFTNGIYYYSIESKFGLLTKKMVLLK